MAELFKKQDLSKRVHLIDEVRGFSILCMVVYHTLYDLVAIFGQDIPIFFWLQKLVPIFVFAFVFISGTACAYSKSNLIRGLKCLGLGLIMTVVTYFFMPSQLIVYGILHMLGSCMIIYGEYELIAKHDYKKSGNQKLWYIAIAVFVVLFFITYNVPNGYFGFGAFRATIPRAIYNVGWLFPLGFTSPVFESADYFSLLPWLFAFLAGSAFGKLLHYGTMPKFLYNSHLKPLAFVGRNTLIIYILHQPVVFGALYLWFMVF